MLHVISGIKTFVNRGILNSQNVSRQMLDSFIAFRFAPCTLFMKRTRYTSKTNSTQKRNTDNSNTDELTTKSGDIEQHSVVENKNLQNQSLNAMVETSKLPLANVKNPEQKQKSKLNLKSLRDRNTKVDEELKPNTLPPKNKPRAVVDLKMMKEELKQLEDPPLTEWEKELCSNRLPFSFFDSPCEELAQNLLGKILVRCLENGTILKGRIVETEGYLGIIDKASHTYQNKITPRNIPMYMPPGTIYVYMTYGMYHCFNISSQESGAHVLIKAVEPILGLEYMELLRNMQCEKNKKEKKLVEKVQNFKTYELCNNPTKICMAFVIDEDNFNQKKIYKCSDLWIECDPYIKSTTIVAANSNDPKNNKQKIWRYYVLGSEGCAVLIRAIEPLEGTEYMANHRTRKGSSSAPKKPLKDLKTHELCNGPSKLCMAFQLYRSHSKYSLCSWKSLWIENGEMEEMNVVKCRRIGIDNYGEEWTNKPLRYYIHGNKAVSKRNKEAELLLKLN
ncbi:DNA-3-methyladenine glycosylase [Habropoda laboriosa]|uniref:DNA-3-methyladenine glycosylase n=1 Tax=Habropoda laboriosa TaxID=597456 RepID=A0A0L7RF81_9HYME|nr:DNA-3-methyladenine glycosylase [Habropoda laboriosa]